MCFFPTHNLKMINHPLQTKGKTKVHKGPRAVEKRFGQGVKDDKKVGGKVSRPNKRGRRAVELLPNMAPAASHLPSSQHSSPSQPPTLAPNAASLLFFLAQNANDCCEGTGRLMTTKGRQRMTVAAHL